MESLKHEHLGPDWDTSLSSNHVEGYRNFLSLFFFLILSERHHIFTLAYFLLKPQWISSPSLLQQETSLYIFKNWNLLSASAQPVKTSVFPSQLMSLFVQKRWLSSCHIFKILFIFFYLGGSWNHYLAVSWPAEILLCSSHLPSFLHVILHSCNPCAPLQLPFILPRTINITALVN